ncbi:hypothetical protein K490DRAFT_69003 [Saccharata proteae CBS 121410]|uniref:Uncharacterized protein n=1 Tax=Saccharata proteae CBS 121410 TaxID=1314787 RepID=A0A9P4HPS9_9PEZI|nr:hypothetical protein K490DRAFT_69003 [Saccharata proteae CBS 121410]
MTPPLELLVAHSKNSNEATILTKTLEAIIEQNLPFDTTGPFDFGGDPGTNHYDTDMVIECKGQKWAVLKQTLQARSYTIRHMLTLQTIRPNVKMIHFPEENPSVLKAAIMFIQTGRWDDLIPSTESIACFELRIDKVLNTKLIPLADRLRIPGLKFAALGRLQHSFENEWDTRKFVDLAARAYSQKFYKDLRLRLMIAEMRTVHQQELLNVWGADHPLIWRLPTLRGLARTGEICIYTGSVDYDSD